MKVCIINGSPRRNGNTAELLKPFRERLLQLGVEIDDIFLKDYKVRPCLGCYACQNVSGEYGCVQKDDAEEIWRQIGETDLLVLATPIYSWYCTAEMKALMDRHYALNKYYGSGQGQLIPRLSVALLTTHGYKDEYANEPFETGIRRLCKHCHWDYLGRYSARDIDGISDMQTEEAMDGARRFADELLQKFNAKC
ncbi:MAG: flavodoxin family protein [Firmicutes bacterium]|nr:flavodoxin family protein [Bacillota bacterium]